MITRLFRKRLPHNFYFSDAPTKAGYLSSYLRNSHYFAYLETKTSSRSIILIVPVLGNLLIAIQDIYCVIRAEEFVGHKVTFDSLIDRVSVRELIQADQIEVNQRVRQLYIDMVYHFSVAAKDQIKRFFSSPQMGREQLDRASLEKRIDDDRRALNLYLDAVYYGSVEATYQCGRFVLALQTGIEQQPLKEENLQLARQLLRAAAALGHPLAQASLRTLDVSES